MAPASASKDVCARRVPTTFEYPRAWRATRSSSSRRGGRRRSKVTRPCARCSCGPAPSGSLPLAQPGRPRRAAQGPNPAQRLLIKGGHRPTVSRRALAARRGRNQRASLVRLLPPRRAGPTADVAPGFTRGARGRRTRGRDTRGPRVRRPRPGPRGVGLSGRCQSMSPPSARRPW